MKKDIPFTIALISLFIILISLGMLLFPRFFKKTENQTIIINGMSIDKNQDEPIILKYKDESLNGSDPLVYENMIPVYYDENSSEWKKADTDIKWYDYENNWWANVVVVKPDYLEKYKKLSSYSKINISEIYGFFVWVPRFEYKLFNVNNEYSSEQYIEINIINKDDPKKINVENGEYYTHPAFTAEYKNGESYELSGLWIAKFEPSLDVDNNINILPNKKPLVNLNMADMWNYARGASSTYQIGIDSRIITNMEWGAIAYFSFSKYGKPGNDDYSNNNKRIYINNAMGDNNWNNLVTGCSSGTIANGGLNKCSYTYDVPLKGTGASSTGNIYGIYDLVGGAWECVMGLVSSDNIPSYIGGYNGTPPKETRYYTLYKNGNMLDATRGLIGDATRETKKSIVWNGSWYGNLAYFATQDSPWIKRGGSFRGGGYSGLFDYGVTSANPRGDKTFRIVLSEY